MEKRTLKSGDEFTKININGTTYLVNSKAIKDFGFKLKNGENSFESYEDMDGNTLMRFEEMYRGYELNELASDLLEINKSKL